MRGALNLRNVHVLRHVRVNELIDGEMLADDVRSIRGTLLCARGHEVTPSMRARLKSYIANVGIQGPIAIFVSADVAAETFGEEGRPASASTKSLEEPNWADLWESGVDVEQPLEFHSDGT